MAQTAPGSRHSRRASARRLRFCVTLSYFRLRSRIARRVTAGNCRFSSLIEIRPRAAWMGARMSLRVSASGSFGRGPGAATVAPTAISLARWTQEETVETGSPSPAASARMEMLPLRSRFSTIRPLRSRCRCFGVGPRALSISGSRAPGRPRRSATVGIGASDRGATDADGDGALGPGWPADVVG